MTTVPTHDPQVFALAGQVAEQLFGRFRHKIPLPELKSLAVTAAITAGQQWDGRGSFPRFVVQRTRWSVLDELRRERRHTRLLLEGRLSTTAAFNAERTADATALAEETASEPAPAAAAIADFLRAGAASFTIELDAAGALSVPDAREDVESHVERMRVRRAVEALPEAERTVVEQHGYQGETFERIAAAAGLEPSTVFSRYSRAVEKLRRAFEEGR